MGEITTKVLAEEHGISERTARRWLVQSERANGAGVVARRGRKLVTTRKALAKVIPDARDDIRDEDRIRKLEEKVGDLEEGAETMLGQLRTLFGGFDRLKKGLEEAR